MRLSTSLSFLVSVAICVGKVGANLRSRNLRHGKPAPGDDFDLQARPHSRSVDNRKLDYLPGGEARQQGRSPEYMDPAADPQDYKSDENSAPLDPGTNLRIGLQLIQAMNSITYIFSFSFLYHPCFIDDLGIRFSKLAWEDASQVPDLMRNQQLTVRTIHSRRCSFLDATVVLLVGHYDGGLLRMQISFPELDRVRDRRLSKPSIEQQKWPLLG